MRAARRRGQNEGSPRVGVGAEHHILTASNVFRRCSWTGLPIPASGAFGVTCAALRDPFNVDTFFGAAYDERLFPASQTAAF